MSIAQKLKAQGSLAMARQMDEAITTWTNAVNSREQILDRLDDLEDKVDLLLRRLELIFGDQVLVNGRFIDTGTFTKR